MLHLHYLPAFALQILNKRSNILLFYLRVVFSAMHLVLCLDAAGFRITVLNHELYFRLKYLLWWWHNSLLVFRVLQFWVPRNLVLRRWLHMLYFDECRLLLPFFRMMVDIIRIKNIVTDCWWLDRRLIFFIFRMPGV